MADEPERVPTGEPNSDDAAAPDPFTGPEWPRSRYVRRRKARGVARLRKRRAGRSARNGKRSQAKRIAGWAGGLIGLLVLLSLAWLVYSGLRARGELQAVRDGVHTMRSQLADGDLTAALTTAHSVQAHAAAAHDDTTGPVWALGAAIPGLGSPLDTTRTLTASVRLVADRALSPLLDAAHVLNPAQLHTSGNSFDLGKLEALDPSVHGAARALQTALGELRASDGSTWLSRVNTARAELIDQLVPLSSTVQGIGRALDVVPTILGADGPRTYMISFQNDAEIRATGGIPGAFAIVRADAGKISFARFEPDNYLVGPRVHGLDFGRDYQSLYPTAEEDYRDSNYSPHFPYAAQIWSKMWEQKTGQQLDGAMILDPTALSHLLQVTGPVKLSDGNEVTAENVVSLTQQQLYAKFPRPDQNDERKSYLLDIAKRVSTALLGSGVDTAKLLEAAARAADEHRLLFWSRDANVEQVVSHEALGGTLENTDRPYVALALDNESQSKLDYYLHASMDWHRTGCGPTRNVTVTVKLTNDAPDNLPGYVLGNSFPAGKELLGVGLYGTAGGKFTRVRVNGHQPFNGSGTDQGHPVYQLFAWVPRGKTTTMVFHLKEPAGHGPVLVRDQPMINPMKVTVTDDSC